MNELLMSPTPPPITRNV